MTRGAYSRPFLLGDMPRKYASQDTESPLPIPESFGRLMVGVPLRQHFLMFGVEPPDLVGDQSRDGLVHLRAKHAFQPFLVVFRCARAQLGMCCDMGGQRFPQTSRDQKPTRPARFSALYQAFVLT
jgi:hypothetical protein